MIGSKRKTFLVFETFSGKSACFHESFRIDSIHHMHTCYNTIPWEIHKMKNKHMGTFT